MGWHTPERVRVREDRLGVRAGVAALVAAVVVAAGVVAPQFVMREATEPAWFGLDRALWIAVMAGLPTVGGALLLSKRVLRRQVGGAMVAALSLPFILLVPWSVYSALRFPSLWRWDTAGRVVELSALATVLALAAAGVLACVALVRDPSVRWCDPRETADPGLRGVLAVAIVAIAVAGAAPGTRPVAGTGDVAVTVDWFGVMFAAGLDPSVMVAQVLSSLLPAVGVAAVGVAVAGARPVRLAVAGAAIVAMQSVAKLVVQPLLLANPPGGQSVELTVWFWFHVLAVAALAAGALKLRRSSREEDKAVLRSPVST